MKALLATVEQSGTRFVLGLFGLTAGATVLENEERNPQASILYAHLTDEQMPLIRDAARRMPIITTHRDPRLIRASWERRGKDLAELDRQLRNYQELLTFHPAVITMWGGFERLPPYYMWFRHPTPEEVDAERLRQPGFAMSG
jgi:hypothetical protein